MIKKEPIFKSIFGKNWKSLPVVIRKHYANYPYSDDCVLAEGKLDVMCAGPIKILAPLLTFMNLVPPFNEKDVSVEVKYESDPRTKVFHLKRVFHFNKHDPYFYHSRMVQVKDDEVIELMPFCLGWRMKYAWDDNRVKLIHKGYFLAILGLNIPIPLTFLLGTVHAEERAIDDDNFHMQVNITHPLWGKIYEYKGQFRIRVAE